MLAARIDIKTVSDIFAENVGLGSTGETYLINSFNFIVSKSRFIEDPDLYQTFHSPEVDSCFSGAGEGTITNYINYRGKNVIGVYRLLPFYNICLFAELGEEEVFASVQTLSIHIFLLAVMIILISGGAGLFVSGTIIRPVQSITDVVEKISIGQLDVVISPELLASKNEVGRLARAFNRTIISLKLAMLKTGKMDSFHERPDPQSSTMQKDVRR